MKKILLLLLSLVLISCTHTTKKLELQGIENITYQELEELKKQDVSFMIYIGRPDCGDCQQFQPLLEDYLNTNKVGVYYLNTKAFRDAANKDNASEDDKSFYEQLRKDYDFDWTPTLEIIENGKIIKKYQYLDMDYYDIKDREKQIERRKEFEQEFETYMNAYFKE